MEAVSLGRGKSWATGLLVAALALGLDERPARADETADAGASSGAPSGPWSTLAETHVSQTDTRACSRRIPLCVHAPVSAGAASLAALASLERAWDVLTGALRIPPPDVGVERGKFDVVLERDVPGGWETRPIERDARASFDRAFAEASLDVRHLPGCALDVAAFRALARASLFRVTPAATEGVARGQVAYLSGLAFPCGLALSGPEVEAFQARPDRAIADVRVGELSPSADDAGARPGDTTSRLFADGAALAWSRLDWKHGRNPGDIVRATWMLAPTKRDPARQRLSNEPDAFDVLAALFKGPVATGRAVADALLDVAIARAFVGASDDGEHQPELRVLGDAAVLQPDWDLPWPSQARRIAPRTPVAPTGASYVVVRTAGAGPAARLRLEAAWEEHALFRWAVVKMDAAGREIGRIVVPTRERATEAQMTIVELAGVDRLLLVGMNAGDPAYPFDPDDEVWEPHGFLLSLAAE